MNFRFGQLSSLVLGGGLGVIGGFVAAQQTLALKALLEGDPVRTLANPPRSPATGKTFEQVIETEHYCRSQIVENGIERIVYVPQQRRYQTPIVMQHGMWHGAWAWQPFQEQLAELGWETHAHSLPGHAASPAQRHISWCTLDYYLAFYAAEAARVAEATGRRPVLMGHSMGGALTQWYLKYVGDDLPAAVLVAPWTSHTMLVDGVLPYFRRDLWGLPACVWTWRADTMRSPALAAANLISNDALYTPAELFARLGPESVLVLMQHNPPFWSPPTGVKTPLLWLAGEKDALIAVEAERRSAQHYHADFHIISGAGHNIMMEKIYPATAQLIHEWLGRQGVN